MTVTATAQVQEHAKVRTTLESRLAATEGQRTVLVAERNQLAEDAREAAIAAHLGRRSQPATDSQARLAAIDAEIRSLDEALSTLKEALTRHDVDGQETRRQAQVEARQQALSRAKQIVIEVFPKVVEIANLQDELQRIQSSGALRGVSVPQIVFVNLQPFLRSACDFTAPTLPTREVRK
jgi:hypothetical protein